MDAIQELAALAAPRRAVQCATLALHANDREGQQHFGDELHKLVGFPVQFEPVECLEHESRVTHPRVAVVPVPLSAGCLWEGGSESRDRRAGRHKGQTFDGECRALDWYTVMVVRNASPSEPHAPIPNRGCDPSFSFLGVQPRFGIGACGSEGLAFRTTITVYQS